MTQHPAFANWQHDTLAKFALEQYLENKALRDALEQVRQDFKDAMTLIRLMKGTL